MLGQACAVPPHVELVLGARPPQPGERLPEVRMLQQTRDRVRERLEVAGGHEQTAAAVIQRLRDAGDSRRDHRRTESPRSEEHTSELQSPDQLVCRLLLEKKNSYSGHLQPFGRPTCASGARGINLLSLRISPFDYHTYYDHRRR